MQKAEWYDWQIGTLDTDGAFHPDESGSKHPIGNMMYLTFPCYKCPATVEAYIQYDPVPMHYESILDAAKVKPKCKCGRVYTLCEESQTYRLTGKNLPIGQDNMFGN